MNAPLRRLVTSLGLFGAVSLMADVTGMAQSELQDSLFYAQPQP